MGRAPWEFVFRANSAPDAALRGTYLCVSYDGHPECRVCSEHRERTRDAEFQRPRFFLGSMTPRSGKQGILLFGGRVDEHYGGGVV